MFFNMLKCVWSACAYRLVQYSIVRDWYSIHLCSSVCVRDFTVDSIDESKSEGENGTVCC